MRLEPARVHPLLADLPEVVHVRPGAGEHSPILAAVALLDRELEQPRPGADAVIGALLDMLLLYILRSWLARPDGPPATGWAMALRDPAISAALSDIHGDPGRAWTVATLARQAGLSRAAFSQRFHALVGQPPLTYLTWWRMTLAARLLRESDLPNGALARRLGYSSEFSFGKAFKRHHEEFAGLVPVDGEQFAS